MFRLSTRILMVTTALCAVAVLATCGNGGTVDEGMQVFIYGPAGDGYSDINPFLHCGVDPTTCQCDFVKLCWQEKGSTKLKDCTTVPFEDAGAVLELPFDTEVCVVAECYQSRLEPATGQTVLEGPRAKGQSCPVVHESGQVDKQLTIYMLPISTFGPTYDPIDWVATSTFAERWGAVSSALFDGSILIAGGADLTSSCADWWDPNCVDKVVSTAELYNPGSQQVLLPSVGKFDLVGTDVTQRMSEQRAFAAAVALPSGDVAVFGGLTAANTPSKTVDIYSPTYRTFVEGPAMEHTRAYHTATLFSSEGNGFVLLVGGLGSGDATWEVWTPDVGTTISGQLNESRWHHTATLVNKALDEAVKTEVVLIAGGEGQTPGAITVRDTLEIFDIANQDFQAEQPPLCSNGSLESPDPVKKTMHAAALVAKRHFIYIAGGFSDAEHITPVRDICVWHTIQGKWQGEAGKFMLNKPRGALSATALPGNVVLFAGGLTKSGGELQTVDTVEIVFEYLNDKGETVVDIGPDAGFPITMITPRWDHGDIVGCDGKVLFYGGLGGSPASPKPLSDTEVFNPL